MMTSRIKRWHVYAGFVLLALLFTIVGAEHSFYLSASGLTISSSVLPWDPAYSYLAAFTVASVNSIAVGLLAVVLCTAIGVMIGVIGTLDSVAARGIYRLYVGSFRSVPVLFVILLCYFFGLTLPPPSQALDFLGLVFLSNRGLVLPASDFAPPAQLALACVPLGASIVLWRLGLPMHLRVTAIAVAICLALWLAIDVTAPERSRFGFRAGVEIPLEFLALTAALSLYYASEIAEVTRGAILSIDRGIIEASHALGLRSFDRFRRIVAPLAARFGLPAALNSYLVVMKATSLGVAIGYTELFAVTRLSMSSSGRIVECLTLMAFYFLLICGTLSLLVNRVNARLARQDRSHV